MATVEFCAVEKVYANGTRAVRDFSLSIDDGEFVVLVGPSGCGKSTLMRMLAGLELVSSGEIRIDGQVVNDWTPQRRNVAMVFQDYALYPHLSVSGNLAFPLRMRKLPKRDIDRRVAEVSTLLGLGQLLARLPAQLSGGQRQRVAMGRALVRDPSVFLMDEPLSNLDARLRAQIRAEFGALRRQVKKTTLYVTHDQVEAMTLGDRVCVINEGAMQQVATPMALYEWPANTFVAGFLGSPGMNLLAMHCSGFDSDWLYLTRENAGVRLARAVLPIDNDVPVGADIILGVRPEALIPGAAASDRDLHLEVEVEGVESLGHERLLYARPTDADSGHRRMQSAAPINGDTGGLIVARVPASYAPAAGSVISLRAGPDDIHLFDAAGRRLK